MEASLRSATSAPAARKNLPGRASHAAAGGILRVPLRRCGFRAAPSKAILALGGSYFPNCIFTAGGTLASKSGGSKKGVLNRKTAGGKAPFQLGLLSISQSRQFGTAPARSGRSGRPRRRRRPSADARGGNVG